MVAQSALRFVCRAFGRRFAAFVAILLLACFVVCSCGHVAFAEDTEPDHTLTYTTGKLTWDGTTGIDSNGSAVLSLFGAKYQNVLSENDDRVVAPGTEGENVVRLRNDAAYPIKYVAVMYRTNDVETLPVLPELSEDARFSDAETYPLPDGVQSDQVVRAVTGMLDGCEAQDFRIEWSWDFFLDDKRDSLDTYLGNQASMGNAAVTKAGLYIVVEEEPGSGGSGEADEPDVPTDSDGSDDSSDASSPDAKPDGDADGSDGGEGDSSGPGVPDDSETSDGSNASDGLQRPSSQDVEYIYPELPKTGDGRAWAVSAAFALAALGAALMAVAYRKGR